MSNKPWQVVLRRRTFRSSFHASLWGDLSEITQRHPRRFVQLAAPKLTAINLFGTGSAYATIIYYGFFFLPFRNKWAGNVEGECRVLFLAVLRNVVVTQKLTVFNDCRNIAFTLQVNGIIINGKCRWEHSTLDFKTRLFSSYRRRESRTKSCSLKEARTRGARVLHN